MAFDTSLRDAAVARRRRQREALRLEALEAIRRALTAVASDFGIDHGYIYGSVVRPGMFREDSDIDVALPAGDPLELACRLTHAVGREVHVIDLDRSPAARRARREGVRWDPESGRS